jgi:hypothetical protein
VSTHIGRLTFDDRPEVYEHATGAVTIAGAVFCDSLGKADFLRRQVVGLAEPGAEQVIPVIVEDGFSGFVRIEKATAEADGGSMGKFWFRYSVTGIPVLGAELPVVETVVTGALRGNASFVADADAKPFHAVPGSRLVHEWPERAISDNGTTEARVVEGGTVDWQHSFEFAADNIYSGVATWACLPEDWYEGACGVDVLVDGEYLPATYRGTIDDTWIAGNGLVRFRVSGTLLTFEWYHDGDWSTPVDFTIDSTTGPVDWVVARTLVVSPEKVSVALTADTGGQKARASTLTCTLRRGSPWVDFRLAGFPGAPEITADPTTSATDMTYGMRRTTAASGWIWVVATTIANTVNTGSGIIEGTSDPIESFGIGAYHSAWTGNLDAADIHKEWYAAQSERTVIGNRL